MSTENALQQRANRGQSSITCKAPSLPSVCVESVRFCTVSMYCYVHGAAVCAFCSCCSSAEVSGAIILITLGTLEPHRANAPKEVGILSLSAARSHSEDSLQTAWTDSCAREGKKGGKRSNTHITNAVSSSNGPYMYSGGGMTLEADCRGG